RIANGDVVVFEVVVPNVDIERVEVPRRDRGTAAIETVARDQLFGNSIAFIVAQIDSAIGEILKLEIAQLAVGRELARSDDTPAVPRIPVKREAADLVVPRIPTQHRSSSSAAPHDLRGGRILADDLCAEVFLVCRAGSRELLGDAVCAGWEIEGGPDVSRRVLQRIQCGLYRRRVVVYAVAYCSEILHTFPTCHWACERLIERAHG